MAASICAPALVRRSLATHSRGILYHSGRPQPHARLLLSQRRFQSIVTGKNHSIARSACAIGLRIFPSRAHSCNGSSVNTNTPHHNHSDHPSGPAALTNSPLPLRHRPCPHLRHPGLHHGRLARNRHLKQRPNTPHGRRNPPPLPSHLRQSPGNKRPHHDMRARRPDAAGSRFRREQTAPQDPRGDA